ncbi:cob(I)yrinic acid a,c-diamide adenosyltransferase [Spiroplasma eriocheiris]|uniref:Cobalamin adenosyltransferase n=1 Tax=Spiroplasma eriocheiris TaxID=315358 RepID=A0A0H3XLT6_9MOLU|nr:cob(I)yrinic acid a,c-diamide adenosyltransferase [Spiroplasma eriocheiris]AHF57302.1 putative cob(I)alamin adenosyltransferase [Spiroplasma eriocheiris CCTCC M 207170]AKM53762.1 cobalamin adenosyltransferase [Spiroplasma eriocheiris]
MQKKGYTHIYYGDGKGKTSILNGMTIRALGYNWNVKYLRFLKNRQSGEMLFFEQINHPHLEIYDFYSSSQKFFWEMNDQEKAILKEEMRTGFATLQKLVQSDNVDLIIVDELLGCIVNGLITEEELITVIKTKKPNIELAFSGHHITQNLIDNVDLVSNVKLIKHYFYEKIPARKGIEF